MAAVSPTPTLDILPQDRAINSFRNPKTSPLTMAHLSQSRSAFLPNGAAPPGTSGPVPGARPLLPNQGQVIDAGATRILCVADVRGKLSTPLICSCFKTNTRLSRHQATFAL